MPPNSEPHRIEHGQRAKQVPKQVVFWTISFLGLCFTPIVRRQLLSRRNDGHHLAVRDGPAPRHLSEHTLMGHDAGAGPVEDGAVAVALLSDLR